MGLGGRPSNALHERLVLVARRDAGHYGRARRTRDVPNDLDGRQRLAEAVPCLTPQPFPLSAFGALTALSRHPLVNGHGPLDVGGRQRQPSYRPRCTRSKSKLCASSNFVTCIVTSVHFSVENLSRPRRALLCLGRPLAPAAGGAAWPIGALAAELAARPTTTTPADRR